MYKTFRNSVFIISIVISNLVAQNTHAARLISYCTMDHGTKTIKGKDVNVRHPIASVSKLFTSLVAATSYSLDYKFSTQVYATPIGKGQFDVHIAGSPDPYFNRFKMHMIVSKLNEAGVKSIRYLTFDENVKYLHDTDSYKGYRVGKTYIRPLILKAEMSFPDKFLVKAQLQQQSTIMKDYYVSYNSAKAAGIDMFKSPSFKVYKTDFKSSAEFKPSDNAIKIYVASQDMRTIIKSMNWNSNNFSANRLLVASGGLEKLHNFYYNILQMPKSELEFVNGSGQNHDLKNGGRLYNEASCNVVVRTVRALRLMAEKQNKKIQDLVAVMGVDKGSTVAGTSYTNSITSGKAVAKTGTIGTHVTLAGMVHGEKDDHYFMYSVAVNGTRSDENRARRLISGELQKFVKSVKGTSLNYIMDNPLRDNLDNYDEDSMDELGNQEAAPTSVVLN